MNLNEIQVIGTGAYFPITLETKVDSKGAEETVMNEDNEVVPKVGWYLMRGKPELINQNIRSMISTQIGQMIRNEYFGTRLIECLEEPNTQALQFLVRRFIKSSIESWEPRLNFLESKIISQGGNLYISIRYEIINSQSIENLDFSYNPKTNNIEIL